MSIIGQILDIFAEHVERFDAWGIQLCPIGRRVRFDES